MWTNKNKGIGITPSLLQKPGRQQRAEEMSRWKRGNKSNFALLAAVEALAPNEPGRSLREIMTAIMPIK